MLEALRGVLILSFPVAYIVLPAENFQREYLEQFRFLQDVDAANTAKSAPGLLLHNHVNLRPAASLPWRSRVSRALRLPRQRFIGSQVRVPNEARLDLS